MAPHSWRRLIQTTSCFISSHRIVVVFQFRRIVVVSSSLETFQFDLVAVSFFQSTTSWFFIFHVCLSVCLLLIWFWFLSFFFCLCLLPFRTSCHFYISFYFLSTWFFLPDLFLLLSSVFCLLSSVLFYFLFVFYQQFIFSSFSLCASVSLPIK